MELTPEERRKIYEEEKARIEAREQIERERRKTQPATGTGLPPNVAGLLCYVGGWISGIVFLIIEQKNQWVRFHAVQSIVVFGSLTVAQVILGWIPFIGPAFSAVIWIIGFILWLVLMIKAYHGERYKVAWAGDIAERWIPASAVPYEHEKPHEQEKPPSRPEPPPPAEPEFTPGMDWDKHIGRKVEEYFKDRRGGRITASAFAIAWSIVLLIFFNFYNQYVAYYHAQVTGNIVTWTRQPFFTDAISLWLPILTTTLIISILGHIVLIIFDRPWLHELVHIIIGAFSLATVITLVSVFPFDFSVIPSVTVAGGVSIGVTVVLICISLGIGIGLVVRAIKLIVNLVREGLRL